MDITAAISDREKEILKISIDEYKVMKTEISAHVAHYRSLWQYIQIVFWGVAALVGFLIHENQQFQPNSNNYMLWVGGFCVFSILSSFYAFGALLSIYEALIISGRMVYTEKFINYILGCDVLAWESRLVENYYGSGFFIQNPAAEGTPDRGARRAFVFPTIVFLHSCIVVFIAVGAVPCAGYFYILIHVQESLWPVAAGVSIDAIILATLIVMALNVYTIRGAARNISKKNDNRFQLFEIGPP